MTTDPFDTVDIDLGDLDDAPTKPRIVQASIGPIRVKDLKNLDDLQVPSAEESAPQSIAEAVGRVIADHDEIHVPDVTITDDNGKALVECGQTTLDHALMVAKQTVKMIPQMPLNRQAGDTIAVVLAVLHYERENKHLKELLHRAKVQTTELALTLLDRKE